MPSVRRVSGRPGPVVMTAYNTANATKKAECRSVKSAGDASNDPFERVECRCETSRTRRSPVPAQSCRFIR